MLICIVIPHFDHLEQFQRILPKLVEQGFQLVVVDDASPQQSFDELTLLLEKLAPQSILVRHSQNQGKGGAVMTGLKTAQEAGFTHALQIDADGQHDIGSVKNLVAQAECFPENMICGEPVFDESISRLRFYSRYITLPRLVGNTQYGDSRCLMRSPPVSLECQHGFG